MKNFCLGLRRNSQSRGLSTKSATDHRAKARLDSETATRLRLFPIAHVTQIGEYSRRDLCNMRTAANVEAIKQEIMQVDALKDTT